MNKYKDRGIIKWSPFDSLAGFNDLYTELKYKLGKMDKPILSEDQLNEMDINLNKAISNNCEISVTYYQDGYRKNIFGYISKIDYLNMCIYIERNKLEINSIVDLFVYD
ncbi:YolD-like family protein [Haploplasma axanthum]|uniref:YolD-like protein n=1 Tax=Haploplasma axanthum TaxID=29552 RepID=A0A449BDL6_HAPAX|nr:YolD-like family protein [Haploplasma axanthum]VEU80525.1 YolD-like protein [Haploplasma axanthum]